MNFQKLLPADLHILAQPAEMVRRWHMLIENGPGDRHEIGMGHPCAVVPCPDLAQLIFADGSERLVIRLGIATVRDEGRHASHREGSAPVTGLDEQLGISFQKRLAHDDLAAVGKDIVRLGAQRLDKGEDIVPAPAIQTDNMVAQRMEDFVHLEGGRKRFDQHGRLDRAGWQAEQLLRGFENLVPECGFLIVLYFRQVEIWPAAFRQCTLGIVEDIEPKIDKRSGNGFSVYMDMVLQQMPAARTDDQNRRVRTELVVLAAFRIGEIELAEPVVGEIDLPFNNIFPCRRKRILAIRHETGCTGVERIDDHLACGWPGDLHAAVEQVIWDAANGPVAFANFRCLGKEVRQRAGIEGLLAGIPDLHELLAARLESTGQRGDERQRVMRQHRFIARFQRPGNLDM